MDIEGSEVKILLESNKIWETRAVCVMENSVHSTGLALITNQQWIDYIKRKSYTIIDFDLKPVDIEFKLHSYNHIWLVPIEKREEFVESCTEVYRKWNFDDS